MLVEAVVTSLINSLDFIRKDQMTTLRRPPSQTSYVYRYQALSSLEQMEKRKVSRLLAIILALERSSKSPMPPHIYILKVQLSVAYVRLAYNDDLPVRVRTRPTMLTINDFSESDCYIRFKFTKPDLYRLHDALKLDDFEGSVRMSNGSKFGTEELLCLSLNRFAFPQKFGEMVHVYGRDWTALCRAFNWFCNYVRTKFEYLLQGDMMFWKPHLEGFSEAVRLKIAEKSDNGIVHHPGTVLVAMFVDDTMTKTCRPGGGPTEEGVGASRFNTLIQQSFYSGYKKIHGIKHQSCELPNGMCADLYGPCSVR